MQAYILEWVNLLLRWTHLITGIAWIGSSFYFIWLDVKLNRPPRHPEHETVAGDLWAVHGGGFYHAQKYMLAPQVLPEPLHWFKWEAYFTWITGFLLLISIYYVNADSYLVDRRIADISGNMAIAISLVSMAAAWLVYHILCQSVGNDKLIAAVGFVFMIITIFALSRLYSGRGLYIQTGAILGTIMVANVFFVIIPEQWELVWAKQRGEEPDPVHGARGKQRSVHNNYLTLPVLFIMLSNHYPMTYEHKHNWLVLITIFIVGVMVRHFFNLRNEGKNIIAIPISAVIILLVLAIASMPSARIKEKTTNTNRTVAFSEVQKVLQARCLSCHSASPDHATAIVAPNGVMFDAAEQINKWAGRIHERTVVLRTMPVANLTGMTEEERQLIDDWYLGMVVKDQ